MTTLRGASLTAALLAALTGAPIAADEPLRVCLLAHNTPYADRETGAGFDIDIATAVAVRLGRKLEPVWTANAEIITEIDESEYPLERLQAGRCDAIFSLAGPASATLRDHAALSLGEPYYGAGFAYVSCDGAAVNSLADLAGRRIAVQSQTVAQFALLAVGADTANHLSVADAIAGVRSGDADGAMVWGPTAGHVLLKTAPGTCRVSDLEPPRALRWNHHVATRAADEALRGAIDEALAGLADDGTLVKLMQRHGLPPFSPFERTYSASAIEELRQALPPPPAP